MDKHIAEYPDSWLVFPVTIVIFTICIVIPAAIVVVTTSKVHRLEKKDTLISLFVNISVSWNRHIMSIDTNYKIRHQVELIHGAIESIESGRGISIKLNIKIIFKILSKGVEISSWHYDVAGTRIDYKLIRKSMKTCFFNIFSNFEFIIVIIIQFF